MSKGAGSNETGAASEPSAPAARAPRERRLSEHLEMALVSAGIGAWSWDIDAGTVDWSPGVASLFDLDEGQFDGTYASYIELVLPEDRPQLEDAIDRCLEEGGDFRVEHRIRKGDGTVGWLECRGRAYRDDTGRAVHMAGTVADVTERKEAEQALRDEKALMAAVLNTSILAVTVVDPDGQIIFANDRAEQILGLHQSQIVRRRYDAPEWKSTSLDGGEWSDEEQPFTRIMTTGEPVHEVQHAIEWPDGTRKILSINGAPIKDENGRIRRLVFSVQDITAARNSELERNRLEAELRHSQKMEAVGRLAGGVAHDFNNLLTAILSCADFARHAVPEDSPAREMLDSIDHAATRAAELTRQLLTFARKQTVEARDVDLNRLVQELGRLLRRVIGENVDLDLRPHHAPVYARVDPGQVEQVLVNLAINARDAMPEGGRLSIRIDAIEVTPSGAGAISDLAPGSYVQIEVADTGFGMSQETLDRIFEPFFTTKAVGRGTGLGLATCHGMVRQAGGHIWARSEPGIGSRFFVVFPRLNGVRRPSTIPPSPELPMGRGTILLVEDDAAVRKVTLRALSAQGYTVIDAASAEEALERARDQPIDLLLTDVILPKMHGKDLAERLRADRPGLKVLFVSGYADDVIVDLGVDRRVAFLPKPYTMAALADRVRRALTA